jgi:RND family efflux transporter MFP subunit
MKTAVVGEPAGGNMRKFPGTVRAVNTSSISFEVGGLVQAVRVDIGDKVKKGELLGVLDKKPFELNVESSRAALSRSHAMFDEKKSGYEREIRIQTLDAGATSQRAVDQALAAFEGTREDVAFHQAQLALVKRDLEKTELRAPFNGVISARAVEPFEKVQPGKPVLELFEEGAMEVEIKVPENLIGNVFVGLHGEVRLPNRPDKVYRAVVSDVGSAATYANAFPVKASVRDADHFVRPGMTAELSLAFGRDNRKLAYLVPVHALAPGVEKDGWSVYVFDPKTSTVRRTAVDGKGIVGNQVVITKGIEPGDVVVVAGVSFLQDGQKVKLAANPAPTADLSNAKP